MNRRSFVRNSAIVSAAGLFPFSKESMTQEPRANRIEVHLQAPETVKTRLAVRELITGLESLRIASEVKPGRSGNRGATVLSLELAPGEDRQSERYQITKSSDGASLKAESEQGLLYAVFDLLEHQGIVFGIDGPNYPMDDRAGLILPAAGQPWVGQPRFGVRGLLPWPDFLNCISVYNDEDFKAYFASILRMRLNMFGMHVYTNNEPGPLAESYLSFQFAGAGHRSALEDTTMTSWGYLPQRTSTYGMGAAQLFDTETFGADATREAADTWEIAKRTTLLLSKAFAFAESLGIRTGIGFEPYQNPTEITRALPPEALSHPGGFVESETAKKLLEARLADLLERYPMVQNVWLWQDEGANWASRDKTVPLSVTPFQQAHAFLQRHAPGKRLVLGGWGGVTRHFPSLHERLPEDIVFSSLTDSLGWNPIDEAYGKLGNRERWPIPWLEDDPSMWFPQFRASRFQVDMDRAEKLSCQGMLGIHWRHRIVDPTATYYARASWDRTLTGKAHYRSFCSSQAAGGRAEKLADLFEQCDTGRAITSTFLGSYDEHDYAKIIELTGDYTEAFEYTKTTPASAMLPLQRATAEQFKTLASLATSPLERDRLEYFSGFVNLMVPYCDAFATAHQLHLLLEQAVKLRAGGNNGAAHNLVLEKCVPMWLDIAPRVRETMLDFQSIVATRNDLGQLCSMQNKFVRLSMERLRLSIEEFVPEPLPAVDAAHSTTLAATGANANRIFLPTRPTLLQPGDALRLFIVVPGDEPVNEVTLHTRTVGSAKWTAQRAELAGRRVYRAVLRPDAHTDRTVEYYASAVCASLHTDPPDAPKNVYRFNVMS